MNDEIKVFTGRKEIRQMNREQIKGEKKQGITLLQFSSPFLWQNQPWRLRNRQRADAQFLDPVLSEGGEYLKVNLRLGGIFVPRGQIRGGLGKVHSLGSFEAEDQDFKNETAALNTLMGRPGEGLRPKGGTGKEVLAPCRRRHARD